MIFWIAVTLIWSRMLFSGKAGVTHGHWDTSKFESRPSWHGVFVPNTLWLIWLLIHFDLWFMQPLVYPTGIYINVRVATDGLLLTRGNFLQVIIFGWLWDALFHGHGSRFCCDSFCCTLTSDWLYPPHYLAVHLTVVVWTHVVYCTLLLCRLCPFRYLLYMLSLRSCTPNPYL